MSLKTEVLSIATIIVALLFAYLFFDARQELRQKTAEIVTLKTDIEQCHARELSANAAIDRQNNAIEAVKIDTVYVTKETQKIVTRYSVARDTIIKSIERDSSCENQIDNINTVMRNFYGVRP